nr:MAG TPA: tail protein [Caudoviricetes sp.]
MIYKAKDGERLDQIVYRHYGHLQFFEGVLELNPKLEIVLKAGELVNLPEFDETKIPQKQVALW